jgi:hypothetical protein
MVVWFFGIRKNDLILNQCSRLVIPYFKLTFFEANFVFPWQHKTCQDFKVYGDDASPEDPSSLIEKYRQFNFIS